MWICSKLGFYSIVRKPDGYHVRARTEGDLKRLLQVAGLRTKVEDWPDADYRWRVRITGPVCQKVMSALGDTVDYPNFKNEILKSDTQVRKLSPYARLWEALRGLQEEAPWRCYECRDGHHDGCVGVPCTCKCPT